MLSNRRKRYPSDLTDAQWLAVEPLLPATKDGPLGTRYTRREILNGILYALQSGCSWRNLPIDFPPWQSVYGHFRRWKAKGCWDAIMHVLSSAGPRRHRKSLTL